MAAIYATAKSEPTVHAVVRVRPKRTLLQSGLLSFAFASVPLFAALYLLGIPLGTWPAILAIQLVIVAISLVALVRYLTSYVAVRGDTILDRPFTARLVRTPVSRVETIILAETYRWNAPDSVPQLLLLDVDGRRVDRMRGTFWREEDMRVIAQAIGRPLKYFPDPITRREFFATYPAARYWFENRVVATIGVVIGFVGALVAVPWLMALVGIPMFAG